MEMQYTLELSDILQGTGCYYTMVGLISLGVKGPTQLSRGTQLLTGSGLYRKALTPVLKETGHFIFPGDPNNVTAEMR